MDMDKLCYVVWRPPAVGEDEFARTLRGPLAAELTKLGAQSLTLHLADAGVKPVQRARLTKLAPPIDGLVSFKLASVDARAPLEQAIARSCGRIAGYLVDESVPLPNTTQKAPLGELVDIMDVGWACAYLATPFARRITGGTVYVDGGANIRA